MGCAFVLLPGGKRLEKRSTFFVGDLAGNEHEAQSHQSTVGVGVPDKGQGHVGDV